MRYQRLAPLLVTMVATAFGCAVEGPSSDSAFDGSNLSDGGGASDASSGSGTGSGGCALPLGAPIDPSSLPSCGPGAHCFASTWATLNAFVAECDGGGLCIPDAILATGGEYQPKACTAFGGAGVCLPTIFPDLDKNKAFMPQDVCAADERCAPCVSPLDKSNTGACDLHFACPNAPSNGSGSNSGSGSASSGGSTGSGGGDDPATCEYDGSPIVEPSKFPACPTSVCGSGGHCIPSAQVPPDLAGNLKACDASSFCVPDPFLEAGGDKIKVTSCTSVNGNEGRCMSMCLPDIAAQASSLPQGAAAGCPETDACVPCFDPISGQATGACTSLPCDKGPTSQPKVFPKCCGGIGSCIPNDMIPAEQQGHLGNDSCGPAAQCAPDALMPGAQPNPFDETGKPCETDWFLQLLGDEYAAGACMPTCIPEVGDSILGSGSCNGDNYVCVPCIDPSTGTSSGACDKP